MHNAKFIIPPPAPPKGWRVINEMVEYYLSQAKIPTAPI
jgi:hypothetical protein